MGFSTVQTPPPDSNLIAELIATNDNNLVKHLGYKIKPITVGREYIHTQIKWSLSDHNKPRLYAEYQRDNRFNLLDNNNLFAEFQL